MDISNKLRCKIEDTPGSTNLFQACKTKEEIDKELSVSEMPDRDFEEILHSKKFAKFKKIGVMLL